MAAAKYEWAVSADGEDWSVVETEDDDTFAVTDDLVGMYVKVTVTAEDGETASDVTLSPVYDSLALLDADQTGAKEVALTTNGKITADDVITVNKGNKAVKIDSTSYTETGAVITLADKIVDKAEYTVTLTPANGDDPTSVTFIGEVASLGEIVFLNDVLVMADSNYSKGYCYVKGYDQYGDEINLSGLNVVSGVGKFESYDPATGKITIDDGVGVNETSPFMTIKEVPVFVQYQNGTTILSAQNNLTVSTQAFLTEMEFGEIKKDGTPRADGRLTVTELSSKKYYIEILNAKDQYGNDLSADDLNTQKNGDARGNKTLFVIPSDSGAFYQTANFGTLDGKTILWLEDTGDSKPGTMALTITGAGGNTFTTDITIDDDPFIQTLNVTYPMLYADVAASDEFEFSAVDQYGDAVDMYDFKPESWGTSLQFTDANHMTNRNTTITLSGDAFFNDVSYNAAKRTFKVTLNTNRAEKGDIISFVATTAGMTVTTASITIGGEGTAAKIKTNGKSVQLDDRTDTTSYNFNGNIAFEDANGNTMKRGDSDWPAFKAPTALLLTAPTSFDYSLANYYWTLADAKLTTDNTAPQTGTLIHQHDGAFDGIFKESEMTGATNDIYAVLWAEQGGKAVLVDQQPFHFTKVVGAEKTYTATCSDTLYVQKRDDGYVDSVGVTVKATTDKGETYKVNSARVTLGGIPFRTSNATVYGDYDLNEVGSKVATVYVDGTEQTSVTINYSNAAPVPTKASYGFTAVGFGDNGNETSTYGASGSVPAPDEFTSYTAALTIDGGVLTITHANTFDDTVTAKIEDQYGQTVKTTAFTANGNAIVDGFTIDGWTFVDKNGNGRYDQGTDTWFAGDKAIIEYAAGGVAGRFTIDNTYGNDIVCDVTPAPVATTVNSIGTLRQAVAAANAAPTAAYTVELSDDVEINEGVTIPDNMTLVVPEGFKLTVDTGKTLTNEGTINNNGEIDNQGTIDNEGVINTPNVTITNKAVASGAMLNAGGWVGTNASTNKNSVVDISGWGLDALDTTWIDYTAAAGKAYYAKAWISEDGTTKGTQVVNGLGGTICYNDIAKSATANQKAIVYNTESGAGNNGVLANATGGDYLIIELYESTDQDVIDAAGQNTGMPTAIVDDAPVLVGTAVIAYNAAGGTNYNV